MFGLEQLNVQELSTGFLNSKVFRQLSTEVKVNSTDIGDIKSLIDHWAGAFAEALGSAINEQTSNTFTVPKIESVMIAAKRKLAGEKTRSRISSLIKLMVDRGIVEVVQAPGGMQPNIYRLKKI